MRSEIAIALILGAAVLGLAGAVAYCVRRFAQVSKYRETIWLEDRRQIREHHTAVLKATTDGMRDLGVLLKAKQVSEYAQLKAGEQPSVFDGVTTSDERDAEVAREREERDRPTPKAPAGPLPRNWHDPRNRPPPPVALELEEPDAVRDLI